MRILIRNGRVVTAVDDYKADILIEGEAISVIGAKLDMEADRVIDAAGKLVSDNFYWLSTKLDTLDWAGRTDTVYTPQKDFSDLTGLSTLPRAKVTIAKSTRVTGSEHWMTVSVTNNGSSVAFMIHPRLTRGKGGDDVVPVFWSDNYFSLLPGEKKSVTVQFNSSSLAGTSPELIVDGWNLEPVTP